MLQFLNIAPAVIVITMLTVNSGNHYAYVAAGLLVIIGAQQAFYRSTDLALMFGLGFLSHVVYSAAHGILWTPMNLLALGTAGSGYLIGFIPAALRIKIQDAEIRSRLKAQRVKKALLDVQAITHLGNWNRDLVSGAVEWSPQLYDIFEMPADTPPAELAGVYERSVHPDDRAEFEARLAACEATREPVTLDHRVIAQSGAVRWVELHGKYEYDESGRPVQWVGAVLDITARKHAEESLVRLARNDALTGLPNRTTVHELLTAEIARATQTASQCAVAFLDLDRFKDINDTLGHNVGDQLLQELSRRVSTVLGAAGVVGRWGGDEFVAIVPGVRDYADVEELARRFIRAISEPLCVDDLELAISASVGIAMYPRDGTEAGVLIRNADTAMYKAKQDLGRGYAFFSDELYAAASRRHYIQNELRRAITDGGLELHYQPIVDAANGHVVAAEALVRWTDPTGRMRLPDEFIAVAEDTPHHHPARRVGVQCRLRACRALATQRHPHSRRRQRVTASVRAPGFRRHGSARTAHHRRRPNAARNRDHRSGDHVERGAGARDAAGDPPHGDSRGNRRLRHRLQQLRLPQALRGRLAQDRPHVRRRHRARREFRDRTIDPQRRAHAGPAGDGRRHRDAGPKRYHGRPRLRPAARLSLRAPRAGRGVRGAVRHRAPPSWRRAGGARRRFYFFGAAFIGTMRCSYGVPAHMTYGFVVSGSAVFG